jgi:hypothetical protein
MTAVIANSITIKTEPKILLSTAKEAMITRSTEQKKKDKKKKKKNNNPKM